MGFKRAQWHSGLTYKQTCEHCRMVITYTDHSLDFRPWYADGFIYCPQCKSPLRHRETYAIDAPNVAPQINLADSQQNEFKTPSNISEEVSFCSQCGKKLRPDDKFCPECGTKRQ